MTPFFFFKIQWLFSGFARSGLEPLVSLDDGLLGSPDYGNFKQSHGLSGGYRRRQLCEPSRKGGRARNTCRHVDRESDDGLSSSPVKEAPRLCLNERADAEVRDTFLRLVTSNDLRTPPDTWMVTDNQSHSLTAVLSSNGEERCTSHSEEYYSNTHGSGLSHTFKDDGSQDRLGTPLTEDFVAMIRNIVR